MFLVECTGCRARAYTENVASPGADLPCLPSDPCCSEDHDHDAAANSCPGGHGGCPTPDSCPVWLGMQPHKDDSNIRDTAAGPCPGGHCGLGVPGCTVCKPLRIELIPGSVQVHHAIGG